MNADSFYFLKDQYFIDLPDTNLMKNHERTPTGLHGRPCFFCMRDKKDKDILWMIPISSKIAKYKSVIESKTKRWGRCDTIVIGKVLGNERAFLLQNMCPATDKYVGREYTSNGKSIQLPEGLKNGFITKVVDTCGAYPTTFDKEPKFLIHQRQRQSSLPPHFCTLYRIFDLVCENPATFLRIGNFFT